MKLQRLSTCLAACAALAGVAHAAPIIIPTNVGIGQDAEVREEAPFQARNTLALQQDFGVRIRNIDPGAGDYSDTNDRLAILYLQFDLQDPAHLVTLADTANSVLRVTARRNNQITRGNAIDIDTFDPDNGANGLVYYGIPNGRQINELTLTYDTHFLFGGDPAPGLLPDGTVGTHDFNPATSQYLGTADFPIGVQNSLPVGGAIDFSSPALDAFLAGEVSAGRRTALIAVALRNPGLAIATATTPGEPNAWVNRTYTIISKETTTLELNPSYDADINDPLNPTGGPYGGASNANGEFSPQLRFNVPVVPEPATVALAAVAGLGLLAVRRK